ncbi:MAG: hypothetical protein WAZ18_06120 [Alphaproteobacteria bacterium]
MSKREVATLLVMGTINRGNGPEFAIFGQQRGLLTPQGKPVASAHKASLIGEHRKPTDTTLLDAVIRGGREELGITVNPSQVVPLGSPVETDKSINTVFVLDTLTSTPEFHCGEGSTAIIPLRDLPTYIENGMFTEASFTTASQVNDFLAHQAGTSLQTPGLREALVELSHALPSREKANMEAMRGELMAVTADEKELLRAIRLKKLQAAQKTASAPQGTVLPDITVDGKVYRTRISFQNTSSQAFSAETIEVWEVPSIGAEGGEYLGTMGTSIHDNAVGTDIDFTPFKDPRIPSTLTVKMIEALYHSYQEQTQPSR